MLSSFANLAIATDQVFTLDPVLARIVWGSALRLECDKLELYVREPVDKITRYPEESTER